MQHVLKMEKVVYFAAIITDMEDNMNTCYGPIRVIITDHVPRGSKVIEILHVDIHSLCRDHPHRDFWDLEIDPSVTG